MITIPKIRYLGCSWMMRIGTVAIVVGIPLMYMTEQAYMWAFGLGCALLLAGTIGMDKILRCPKCGEKLLRLDMGTGVKSLMRITSKPEKCPNCGKSIHVRLK